MSKSYIVNNIKISCPYIVKKLSTLDKERPMSTGEILCDKLSTLQREVDYNSSRMNKLNDEYICSKFYKAPKYSSNHRIDNRLKPNCDDVVYSKFQDKFTKAISEVKQLDTLIYEGFSIKDAQKSAYNALESLKELKSFTYQNLDQVNTAFERALFDTNEDGVCSVIASLVTFGIGFIVTVAVVALSNNDFDGKISRAYEEASRSLDLINKIGETLPHDDIYVY